MQLIEKELRDLIGIDNFERAIVFSSLLIRQQLRQAELSTSNILIFQNFGFSPEGKTTNLTIDVKMPYDSYNFCGFGGDFLSTINEFNDAEPIYEGDFIEPTINNQGLIPDDPDIDTIEQYLIWTMAEWIKLNKQQNSENWDNFGYLSFLEEADPPVISAKVILLLDYEKYLETQNLIASVLPVVSTNNTYNSLIGNNQLFGNSFLVGN